MKIETPEHLVELLLDIRLKIENNEYQPIEQNIEYWEIPRKEHIIIGNWPDLFINYYVEIKTDIKYKLTCDTYHGNCFFEKLNEIQ